MIIGQTINKEMGRGYEKAPMHSFAESFVQLTQNIMNESACELYTDTVRTMMNPHAYQAIKNFFVQESADEAMFTDPSDYDDHIITMEQQCDNDRKAILEHTTGSSMNPMIGMTFPLHKWILMNMVFDKGSIPKFVTATPKFTISMEYRILVDTEGNELDMFRDQNKMTDAINKTAALQEFELPAIPFTDDNEIVHTYLGGLAGADHLSIETCVSAVKVEGVYYEVGDILPDEVTGYVEPTGKVADVAGTHDTWYRVNYPFTPVYGEFDRGLMQPIKITVKSFDGANVTYVDKVDIVSGTMSNDRLNIQLLKNTGDITGLRVTSRLDTSNARATTCSVRWKEKTDIVEIPNAIPINTTVSPEETKDIAALYNVNQVTKIMELTKTVLANYKDDMIKRELDKSYLMMDPRDKTYSQFDFAPREGYRGDHIQWRRDTFMDHFDSQVTQLLMVLNDPNMTVTVFGDPDLVRKLRPVDYSYQSPANIGPVDLDFEHTIVTTNKRVYHFIGSDKLRGCTELIVVLCPRGTDRIIYRIYDYQMYLSNEIRNADNPSLPALHAFERWKFVSYQPVQGRINILHPSGLTDHYDYVQVKNV